MSYFVYAIMKFQLKHMLMQSKMALKLKEAQIRLYTRTKYTSIYILIFKITKLEVIFVQNNPRF